MFLKTLRVSFAILVTLAGTRCHPGDGSDHHSREPVRKLPKLVLSSPSECARECKNDEPPKTCFYDFNIELYPVLGKACDYCTPDSSNALRSNCQCVTANGVNRTAMTVNRMIPGPSIQVCLGDRIVVDVHNRLPGIETAIHFQGIRHLKSQYYDGVPLLTQCPIYAASTFRYQFIADTSGTHFWRSSSGLSKLDGVYGSLIVRVPPILSPIRYLYDTDSTRNVMVISDWMNKLSPALFPGNLDYNLNRRPTSILINGFGQYTNSSTGNTTNSPSAEFIVKPSLRHRFRIINVFSSVCPAELTIEGHTMLVVATDGLPVQPRNITTLISFSGETYDVVIDADQSPCAYWIQVRALGKCSTDKTEQTAILRYENTTDAPASKKPTYSEELPQDVVLDLLDVNCSVKCTDALCIDNLKGNNILVNEKVIRSEPDVKIYIGVNFFAYPNNSLYKPDTYERFLVVPHDRRIIGTMNNIVTKCPTSPPLSQLGDLPPNTLCNENNLPLNCGIPCQCTHVYNIPLDSVVEIIPCDERKYNEGLISFSLHGNYFYLMAKGYSPNPNVTRITAKSIRDWDSKYPLKRNFDAPVVKNTVVLPKGGYTVIKFLASNPGMWLLESQMPFYGVADLGVIFNVGKPSDLPPIPPGFPVCKDFTPPIGVHQGSKH